MLKKETHLIDLTFRSIPASDFRVVVLLRFFQQQRVAATNLALVTLAGFEVKNRFDAGLASQAVNLVHSVHSVESQLLTHDVCSLHGDIGSGQFLSRSWIGQVDLQAIGYAVGDVWCVSKRNNFVVGKTCS